MSYAVMMQYKQTGEEFFKQGDFSRAEKFFKSALEEALLYQPANEYTVQQLKTMGVFYFTQGAYAKAEPYLLQALELERDLYEPQNILLARTLNLLGLVYQVWGQYEQAEAIYKQAVKIEQRAQYLRHPQIDPKLSHQSQHHLAMVYCAQGKQSEAYKICSQTCTQMIHTMGPGGKNLSTDLHTLAMCYCARNQRTETRKIFQWIIDLVSEQAQKEYLGCTLREAVANRHQQPVERFFSPVYEFLIHEDDLWRPSPAYRHEESYLEERARGVESSNRMAAVMEDAWSPAHPFTVKRN